MAQRAKDRTGGPAGINTRLSHGGRGLVHQFGAVNPPIVRATTILFDDYQAFIDRKSRDRMKGEFAYGRLGNPVSISLEQLVAELEGAAECITLSSGVAAVTAALLAFLGSDDHLLVADTVYEPTRHFCAGFLRHYGIDVEFYDPLVGAGIEALCRENTRVIFLESPGSLTFEVQDVPAIAAVARRRGIVSMIDNSWASPLGLKPLALGIDLSIHAGTKHIVGHSDASLGLICAGERHAEKMRKTVWGLGHCAGSEEVYLGLRGIRTMGLRLERSVASGLLVAQWLQHRPEVARVHFPLLPEDPGHALWKRDFTGGCGLFSISLARPYPTGAVAAMVEGYRYFGLGASWGGFESLVLPAFPERLRTAAPWQGPGPVVRYYIGLEEPADLIADLEAGFDRLAKAAG